MELILGYTIFFPSSFRCLSISFECLNYLDLIRAVRTGMLRTHAIITCGLYNFYLTAVYTVKWLVLQTIYILKKGNSSIFVSKIHDL